MDRHARRCLHIGGLARRLCDAGCLGHGRPRQDKFCEGKEPEGGHGGEQPASDGGPGHGELSGHGQRGSGEDDGDGVGADFEVVAPTSADFESNAEGDQVGDDRVGPAEPVAGAGGAVGHGPVVDVAERRSGCGAADDEEDQDEHHAFETLACAWVWWTWMVLLSGHVAVKWLWAATPAEGLAVRRRWIEAPGAAREAA